MFPVGDLRTLSLLFDPDEKPQHLIPVGALVQEVQRDRTVAVCMRGGLGSLKRLLAGRVQLEAARRVVPLLQSSGFVHCGKHGPELQHSAGRRCS